MGEKIPSKPVEYKGKTYPSLYALSKEMGVDRRTLASRLRNGWPIEEAVKPVPKATGSGKGHAIRSKILDSLYDAIQAHQKEIKQQLNEMVATDIAKVLKDFSHLFPKEVSQTNSTNVIAQEVHLMTEPPKLEDTDDFDLI